MAPACIVSPFFSDLDGYLEINRGNNEISAECRLSVYDEATDSHRELTAGEWASMAYPAPTITFRGGNHGGGGALQLVAPSPHGFTVRELTRAIVDHEQKWRMLPAHAWFGGIDTSHVVFEGISKAADGTFCVHWGS